ncbi:hypothetical protein LTR66_001201, partial [Elasticomyces elasticus]
LLGRAGVNIRFMSVAAIDRDESAEEEEDEVDGVEDATQGGTREALMILGIDRVVDESVRKGLVGEEGVLEAEFVVL